MKRASMDRFIDTIEWIAAGFVGLVAADIFISVLLMIISVISGAMAMGILKQSQPADLLR